MNEEFTLDFARLPEQLWTLLTDPASNLQAALVLYAIIGLVLLMVLLAAVMIIMATSEDEEVVLAGGEPVRPANAQTAIKEPRDPRSILITTGVIVLVLAAVWVVTGYTTSHSTLCASCHLETPHTIAEVDRDPHTAVSCVACHEPGGLVGRYTSDMPARVLHFVDGLIEPHLQEEYGRVRQSACTSCHGADIAETTTDELRGLRMSHVEPLEASARCLDCHRLEEGIVASHNAGMNPCLRCHDAVIASAECATCHDKNAAAAAQVRTGSLASVQVAEVRCGSCHDEPRQCDPCHGTRMPHTREFMAYAHARSGAADFWFNSGRTCAGSACHTRVRRSCSRPGCHGGMLGLGHGPFMAESHVEASEQRCNTCHQRWAYTPGRDFCLDVCHTPAAIEQSPR